VAIGSDAGIELAQARERLRLAVISSTLICLEGLIFIIRLTPLYWLDLSSVKHRAQSYRIPFR
jgi:hypothetical protein